MSEQQITSKFGKKFLEVNTDGSINVNLLTNLIPYAYDYVSLGYTGSNITLVVYKTGGATGTIVATLTLAYSGSDLVSIARS